MATEPLVRVVYNGQAYFVPNSLQRDYLPEMTSEDETGNANKCARQDTRHMRGVAVAQRAQQRRRPTCVAAIPRRSECHGETADASAHSKTADADCAPLHERQGWCGTHNVLLCSAMMVTSAVIYLSGGVPRHLRTHVLDGASSEDDQAAQCALLRRQNSELAEENAQLKRRLEAAKAERRSAQEGGTLQEKAYMEAIGSVDKDATVLILYKELLQLRRQCAVYAEAMEETRAYFTEMKRLYTELETQLKEEAQHAVTPTLEPVQHDVTAAHSI